MSTIDSTITVEPDGSAHIDTPTGLPTGRHRVLLFLRNDNEPRDANGWPVGFFDQTYGSCAEDPIPEAVPEFSQEREGIR